MNSDVLSLFDLKIRAYVSLQIPVPNFSREGFVLYHARCTRLGEFRGQKRSDWICVGRHTALDWLQQGSLNRGHMAKLDALFKLKSRDGIVYRLAYVTLLPCITGTTLQGVEGILPIRFPATTEGMVVSIAKIEGMAYLIQLEPGESWLVNNRIDLETWNRIYY